jgi:hypothetical protein
MPRYIIECDDPTDIIFGMKAIRNLSASGDAVVILAYHDGGVWYVKKTKTGYSARTAGAK